MFAPSFTVSFTAGGPIFLFPCRALCRQAQYERSNMADNDNAITVTKNGTTFTVVLKSSENAGKSFEDVMKDMITREAVRLPPDEDQSA